MKRIRPCEFCKRRRRKCERPTGESSCLQCTRLNVDCIFDTDTCNDISSGDSSTTITNNDNMAEVDGNHELQISHTMLKYSNGNYNISSFNSINSANRIP
ncbi:unnamed protein product [Absidia cylindrospora]